MKQIGEALPVASLHALIPSTVQEALELASTLAKATFVPDHLRNKPGDCLLVVMQAQRWGLDAVSVAQCTSVVHGKLCYEGKLIAAVLYAMGAIEGRLDYEIKGEGQKASIVVTGTPRGGRPQSVRGSVSKWRTYTKDKHGRRIDNAWDTMPEDMLVYRGTRQWARRHTPDALLGVYTPDEMEGVTPPLRARVVTESGSGDEASANGSEQDDVVDAEFYDAGESEASETRSRQRPAEQVQLLDPDQRQAELADAIDNAATLGQLEVIAEQIAMLPMRNRAKLRERFSERRSALREEMRQELARRRAEEAEDAEAEQESADGSDGQGEADADDGAADAGEDESD